MIKEIKPSSIEGSLNAPASKSYAQRAIAAALLADGTSELHQMDLCNDTAAALEVVNRLGADIHHLSERSYEIHGGLNPRSEILDIGESGLSTRLFTPVTALCSRPMKITGHGSILNRPISSMENPLRELGVKVTTSNGFLPIHIQGPLEGGHITIDGSSGSQFLTGLLMALPLAKNDSTVCVENLTSKPYIDMTIRLAQAFGIKITHNDYQEFLIKGGQTYCPSVYNIEGDWSGASCLLVAGAVAGDITVKNLNPNSLQADKAIIKALEYAGARIESDADTYRVSRNRLQAFEFDATDFPDLFPALCALAAHCNGTTVLKGTRRLIHKESNRAATLADVFWRLDIPVDIEQEDIMLVKGGTIRGGKVSSHNDHRIAMAAAVAALNASSPVTIEGAEAVTKSYPRFWEDISSVAR